MFAYRPALAVLAGVGVQAVLGGITVRTGLNPATVAAHFLVSMLLVAAASAAYLEARMPGGPRQPSVPPLVRQLGWATCAVAALVLTLGTIVTGSGPHSGDADQPAQLNERLGQFIGMIENERMLDTDARIARGLAALFNPVLYPGTLRLLQISQEELGYLAGVSRQRANQALKVLEDAGLVRSEYGGINILDLDGLRRFGD